MTNKLLKYAKFAAVGGILIAANSSYAVTEQTSVSINIVRPITITEITSGINLGSLQYPASGQGPYTFTVGANGAITDTNNIQVSGSPAPAQYSVAASALTLVVTATDTSSVTGVTLSKIYAEAGASASTVGTDIVAGSITPTGNPSQSPSVANLFVGLEVTIADNAAEGNYGLTYDLDVSYQ